MAQCRCSPGQTVVPSRRAFPGGTVLLFAVHTAEQRPLALVTQVVSISPLPFERTFVEVRNNAVRSRSLLQGSGAGCRFSARQLDETYQLIHPLTDAGSCAEHRLRQSVIWYELFQPRRSSSGQFSPSKSRTLVTGQRESRASPWRVS